MDATAPLPFVAAWGYGPARDQQNEAIEVNIMAAGIVPHLANDLGAEKIFIGVKEFQCMGARAPHDHPHVYLDMGADGQILCPYCSTLFVHDPRLAADETDPPGSVVVKHGA